MVTLFGSDQRRGRRSVADRSFAFSLLGAPDLDFRQAQIGSEEVRITSAALIGSLTAKVPAGVEIDLGGFCLVGGNDLLDEGPPSHRGGPTAADPLLLALRRRRDQTRLSRSARSGPTPSGSLASRTGR
jgi:hypothetical protein